MSGFLDSSSIMGLFRHIQGKHFHSAVMTLKKIKDKKGTHLVFTDQRSTLARQLTILKLLSWNVPTFVDTESKWVFFYMVLPLNTKCRVESEFHFLLHQDQRYNI